MGKQNTKDQYVLSLTDTMIEQQAQSDLLAFIKVTKNFSFPVFPEEIVTALWGTKVIYQNSVLDEVGEGVLAAFIASKNEIHFSVGLASNEGQSSFTLAHEVGHVSLHNFLSKINFVKEKLCRGSIANTGEIVSKRIERQADKYAACLLMPRDEVIARMASFGKRPGDKVDTQTVAEKLQSHFKVSLHALENRLIDLGFDLTGTMYQHYTRKIPDSAFTSDEARADWG